MGIKAPFHQPRRAVLSLAICLLSVLAPCLQAQRMDDTIISEHLRLLIPIERQWLGRETISDLENCYRFVNASTGDKLPRKVLVVIQWRDANAATDVAESSISIGMADTAAERDMRGFLLRGAARELSRLGLLLLARQSAPRPDSEMLYLGMSEILVREHERSTRALESAWTFAHLMDRMKPLRLGAASEVPSPARHDMRAAAPGVTLLMLCRELYGREKLLKLFESLKRGTLAEAITAALKTTPPELENTWLKKVRAYAVPDSLTITSAEDAPDLTQAVFLPATGKAGTTATIKLLINDRTRDLSANGVFVTDESAGKTYQARTVLENGVNYFALECPIEAARKPGEYNFNITVADEAGNVRNWKRTHRIE